MTVGMTLRDWVSGKSLVIPISWHNYNAYVLARRKLYYCSLTAIPFVRYNQNSPMQHDRTQRVSQSSSAKRVPDKPKLSKKSQRSTLIHTISKLKSGLRKLLGSKLLWRTLNMRLSIPLKRLAE